MKRPLVQIGVPALVLVSAASVALVLSATRMQLTLQAAKKATGSSAAVTMLHSDRVDRADRGALASVNADSGTVATASAVTRDASTRGEKFVPAFDIARIEPTGDAVIAGSAAPGARVELLRNGEVHDRAIADQSGNFVMVLARLPVGDYQLTLRSTKPDGKQAISRQSVAVSLGPNPTDPWPAAAANQDKVRTVDTDDAGHGRNGDRATRPDETAPRPARQDMCALCTMMCGAPAIFRNGHLIKIVTLTSDTIRLNDERVVIRFSPFAHYSRGPPSDDPIAG